MSPAGDAPVVRGPYEIHDERFAPCAHGDLRLERLWDDGRWLEGPAYFPAGRYLVFSDIPNDRLLRWDETTGAVGVLRSPAHHPNGNTVDLQGRLVTCEQGERRVTRTEHDGTTTVIADRFRGLRFNSPNDVVVRSDGSIWFTDPDYGIASDYEGHRAESEIGGCHVYRVDPASGQTRVVADDFQRPNGLAFSRDERQLYVADTTAGHIRALDLAEDDTSSPVTGGRVFAEPSGGDVDGLRLDADGRVWTAVGEAVDCYDPDGSLLGRIRVPGRVANLTFGGARRNRMFLCGGTALYSLLMSVNGARRPTTRTALDRSALHRPAKLPLPGG
ncbi:SMP-30/gluconolactonase/LRE family protein [Streptoalloteichus hindustanus]|nr:SMP-30/gluconolactonase/LRE family protein [Streptoalloteichus hindustanus]